MSVKYYPSSPIDAAIAGAAAASAAIVCVATTSSEGRYDVHAQRALASDVLLLRELILCMCSSAYRYSFPTKNWGTCSVDKVGVV